MLTLERAKELNATMVQEKSLVIHATNVMAAMGAMAEHLRHTEKELLEEGVPEEDVRAIMSHGYGICTDVKPESNMEKSLYTVDELTGIIQAAARIRPHGITDLSVKSFMKKYKTKAFAAKCDRELIEKGCEMLGMDVREVAEICIEGMKPYAADIGLLGTEAE